MSVSSRICLLILAACAAAGARAQDAADSQAARHRFVRIETSMGNIDVELYADQAPETVRNFMAYISEKFYDGTIFHRVAEGLVIQGGGYTPDLKEKPAHGRIKNEAENGLMNVRGTIGIARNADPDSATSQFYINVADNIALNHLNSTPQGFGYCVFGRVTAGMDVVDKINAVAVDKGEKKDNGSKSEPKLFTSDGGEIPSVEIPKEPVLIKSVQELPGK
jgi:cyclophilin family peptidyl-prolyl cis-trans isomerase